MNLLYELKGITVDGIYGKDLLICEDTYFEQIVSIGDLIEIYLTIIGE